MGTVTRSDLGRPWWLLAGLLGAACSVALDFDDLEGLPCPCQPNFVCLRESSQCILAGSVDPYKSCATDTPLTGDELCPENHRCVAVNGRGPRCLPQCTPVDYARPDDGARIAAQCDFGRTCWPSNKDGVCSEGVCRDNPNEGCGPAQRCGVFNGAGVCFTTCEVERTTAPFPCGGNNICHPIGLLDLTACVAAGSLQTGDICTLPDEGMCQKVDDRQRLLICARPEASSGAQLRCAPVCNPNDQTQCVGAENCVLVRANVDAFARTDVGICE